MNNDLVRAARLLQRRDFYSFARHAFNAVEPGQAFVDAWYIHHLCHVFQDVAAGRIRRLIIAAPPRSLKSFLGSIAFPAWVLGNDPTKRFICVSHSEPLARYFGSMTRTIMQQQWYGTLFPKTRLTSRRPNDGHLRTAQQGSRLAIGIGGAITGHGADGVICDDPTKAQDALTTAGRCRTIDYVESTLLSRLNDRQRGVIILIMQRLHEDDLAGHLMRTGRWHVVSLPMTAIEDTRHRIGRRPGDIYNRPRGELLHPLRDTQEALEEQRVALGPYNYPAQYQQTPVPEAGNIVRREWLQRYDTRPNYNEFDRIVLSWDTASTLDERNDFSVGTVWGRLADKFYLLEVIRDRWEVPDLQRQIVEATNRYDNECPGRVVCIVEDDGIGRGIVQNIRQNSFTRPLPNLNRPNADKAARFLRHMPLFEQGRVLLPTDETGLEDYVSELLAFPRSRYDDQIDSTSQALDDLIRDFSLYTPPERQNPRYRDPPRRNIRRRNFIRR